MVNGEKKQFRLIKRIDFYFFKIQRFTISNKIDVVLYLFLFIIQACPNERVREGKESKAKTENAETNRLDIDIDISSVIDFLGYEPLANASNIHSTSLFSVKKHRYTGED